MPVIVSTFECLEKVGEDVGSFEEVGTKKKKKRITLVVVLD